MKNQKQPSAAQWKELYEIAGNIRKMEPWEYLWDSELLVIRLPDHAEPFFCSVMGGGGEVFAIGVYPGYDAFLSLSRIMEGDSDDAPSFMAGLDQKCLMCNFGGREEVDTRDRAVMKELGLSFRGKNNWIYFRAMEPGFFPWFIDAAQADILIRVLQNFYMLCAYYIEGKLKANFEEGEVLTRFYSEEDDLWRNAAIPLPPIPVEKRTFVIDDALLMARMKKSKVTPHVLELEIMYYPMPVQEQKDEPPYLPKIILLFDREIGIGLHNQILDANDNIENEIITALVNYINENGRPRCIYIRDGRNEGYISDFCQKANIKLIQSEGMPTTDAFLMGLMNFLG